MTGRYLIYTPRESWLDVRQFDSAWHKFVGLCKSLDRDGLTYDVRFNLTSARPHLLVMASGKARPQRRPTPRLVTLPPAVPAQRCRERALEVEWFLPENLGRRNNQTSYWRSRQTRYQELSQLAEDHLRAELDYWRELEFLSNQREHFKPGRTDGTAGLDDEVAA